MYEPDDGQRFDLRSDLADLDRLLDEHRPDLLVLDSFRTLWGGEENDSGDVAKVLDPLRNLVRKHNAGTLLLHHSGKGNASYRGSSAIGASAELGFTLAHDDGDEDRDRRSLTCWKCRPAPKPQRRWLRLTVERGMVLIDGAEPPEDEPPARAPVASALKPGVLAALTDDPQPRADIARIVGRDPKDRSVGRVLDDLAAEGLASKTGPSQRPLWKRQGGTVPPCLPPSRSLGTPHDKRDPDAAGSKVAGGTALKGSATCHLRPEGSGEIVSDALPLTAEPEGEWSAESADRLVGELLEGSVELPVDPSKDLDSDAGWLTKVEAVDVGRVPLRRTWPLPGLCDCRPPARSPRHGRPDPCAKCRRPIDGTDDRREAS
jgi:hypothetical protein